MKLTGSKEFLEEKLGFKLDEEVIVGKDRVYVIGDGVVILTIY